MKKIGRNDPCPCGSGKKYKQCCMGKAATMKEAPVAPRTGDAALQKTLQTAVEHHQAGRLPEAEALYRQILQVSPNHPDALHLSGVIARQNGQIEMAVDFIRKAIDANPADPIYYYNLGRILRDQGKLDDAVAAYRQAISLKPDHVEALNGLGSALREQGHLEVAIASYRQAIAIKPDYAEAHCNLGSALQAQEKLDEATHCYRQALVIRPGYTEAHCYLGNALKDLGRLDEAASHYRQALLLKPDYVDAHNNLGSTLQFQGKLNEAVASYRQALWIDPGYALAHSNLGNALKAQGWLSEALASYMKALQIGESVEAKSGFAGCLINTPLTKAESGISPLLVRAISEAWGRPGDLLMAAKSLINLNQGVRGCIDRATSAWPHRLSGKELFGSDGLAVVADDLLLRCLLENVAIDSLEFERFLTMARRALLVSAMEALDEGTAGVAQDKILVFHCALARQCFINEYIFALTDEESAQVELLRKRLAALLAAGSPVPVMGLVAAAAYSPLSFLPSADALLTLTWPDAVAALLTQQIREPREEQACRASIARLTPIDDGVSRLVQDQYEENPYPRWIKAHSLSAAVSLDVFLHRQFPRAEFQPLGKTDAIDILIAGCGTGQQSIETARQFRGANVLAVDLSSTSLGYAQRKTNELGLKNVRHMQADIMKLAAAAPHPSFDMIESVGVLHHLADPVAGLQILHSLLRPGGFMRLGFYSEIARRDIVAARNFIEQRKYGANAEDIRRCRQELMTGECSGQFKQLLTFRDFYSMSECRDCLFHVQEHRFTIPQLKGILAASSLNFIGFTLEHRIATQYQARFPDDPAQTNLDNWHLFETENPYSFIGMYQFWVQKSRQVS